MMNGVASCAAFASILTAMLSVQTVRAQSQNGASLANALHNELQETFRTLQRRDKGGCFLMTNSLIAPGYDGVAISVSGSYNDTASFDKYISGYFFNGTNAAGFANGYGCPSFTGGYVRYTAALKAAYHIGKSPTNCTNPSSTAPFIQLCRDVCNIAVASMVKTFNDPTMCIQNPSSQILNARNILTTFSSFCSTLPYANNKEGACLDESTDATSANTCGFTTTDMANQYCTKTSPTDDCCTLYNKSMGLMNNPSSSVATDPGNLNTNASSSQASSTGRPNASGLSSNGLMIPLIASGVGFIFLITIASISVRRYYRRKQRKEREEMMSHSNQVAFNAAVAALKANSTRSNSVHSDSQSENMKTSSQYISPQSQISSQAYSASQSYFPQHYSMAPQTLMNTPSIANSSNDAYKSTLIPNRPISEANSTYYKSSANRSSSVPSELFEQFARGIAATIESNDQKSEPGPITADGEIVEHGCVLRVLESYSPKFSDELAIVEGQTILVDATFDDGWAQGRCIETNLIGVFPLELTSFQRRHV